MLTGHSEFYLTQPSIYFGVHGETCGEELDLEPQIEFQFDPASSFLARYSEPPTGMFIDWYDLPN